MKPVLYPVAPTKESAEFLRPIPQPQVSETLLHPVFEDLTAPNPVPAAELVVARRRAGK